MQGHFGDCSGYSANANMISEPQAKDMVCSSPVLGMSSPYACTNARLLSKYAWADIGLLRFTHGMSTRCVMRNEFGMTLCYG